MRGEVTAGQSLDLEAELAQPFLSEVDLPVFKGIFVAAADKEPELWADSLPSPGVLHNWHSAQIETLHAQLSKIGARVCQTARCIRIHLATGWPFQIYSVP
jgi:hypothetical protein